MDNLTAKELKLIEFVRKLPPFCEVSLVIIKHEGQPMKVNIEKVKETVIL